MVRARLAAALTAAAALVLFGSVTTASADGPATISGFVTIDGVPAVGIEVSAFPSGVGIIEHATTGSDGGFTMEVPYGTFTFDIADPTDDYKPLFQATTVSAESPTAFVTLDFLSWPIGTSEITGFVTASGTSDVSGITVHLSGGGLVADQDTGVSGIGEYQLTGLVGGTYFITVTKPGYAQRTRMVTVGDDGDAVTASFTLFPNEGTFAARMQGTVTEGGAPVEGLTVVAVLNDPPYQSTSFVTTTDALGQYSFTASRGTYTITMGGVGTPYLDAAQERFVNSGATETVDFALEPRLSGFISGTVTGGGDPLEDICVDAYAPDGTFLGGTGNGVGTDENGYYEIFDVTAGQVTLLFVDCNWGQAVPWATTYWGQAGSLHDATFFTLGAADALTKDIELIRGGTIEGHVRWQASDVVMELPSTRQMDATVYQFVDGAWELAPDPSPLVSSVGEGSYEVKGLFPGTYRIAFDDYVTGPRAFATEYWNNSPTIEGGNDITVTSGVRSTGYDAVVAITAPTGIPDPVATEDLPPLAEDEVGAASSVQAGSNLEVQVDPGLAGEWMFAFGHSVPVPLGNWVQVSSTGKILVPVPAGMPTGAHTLVVQNAEGDVIGWTGISITAAAATMPVSGATTTWLIPVALLVLLAGIGTVILVRVRKA